MNKTAPINLLPSQLVLKGKDKVLLEGLKKFVLIGFIILIAASLIIAGYLVYLSFRIRSSVGNEDVLKSEISSLQQTEQGLFLIKDRISRIKAVYAKESVDGQIATLTDFIEQVSGDFRISEIQISVQRVDLSVVFPSSSAFGLFYKSLIAADLYPDITLKTLSFNPSLGYIASFELSQK
ncbi:hypothetical protein HY502_03245 [Candidatus Woesebacteria bacterium]|nr:hypothetical protein [Candidatus Woesebacteria bacterium]